VKVLRYDALHKGICECDLGHVFAAELIHLDPRRGRWPKCPECLRMTGVAQDRRKIIQTCYLRWSPVFGPDIKLRGTLMEATP